MPRKPKEYDAKLEKFPDFKIYLNIKHLEKGRYELSIINKNTLVKRTTFKKE